MLDHNHLFISLQLEFVFLFPVVFGVLEFWEKKQVKMSLLCYHDTESASHFSKYRKSYKMITC